MWSHKLNLVVLFISGALVFITLILYLELIIDVMRFDVKQYTFQNPNIIHSQSKYLIQLETHCQYLEFKEDGLRFLLYLPIIYGLAINSMRYSLPKVAKPQFSHTKITNLLILIQILAISIVYISYGIKNAIAWNYDYTRIILVIPIIILSSVIFVILAKSDFFLVQPQSTSSGYFLTLALNIIIWAFTAFVYIFVFHVVTKRPGCI